MKKTMHAAAAFSAAMIAVLALAGCPMQPSYPSTITPIYVATSTGGLFVFNGTGWTNYTVANTSSGLKSSALSSVVVSGSGSGAVVLAGGNQGVSQFDGLAWTQLATGLGSTTVNGLFLGSNLEAATSGGFSILNGDGVTWTNNNVPLSVNSVFATGTYTLVAANAGLYIYYGTTAGTPITPPTIVLGSSTVTAVFVDSLGELVAGTDKGLAILTISGWSSQLPPNTLVHQISLDSNGNLYAATANGLYIIGTTTVRAFSTAALCVCVDGAGTIYAGTATGLQVSTNGGSTWTTQLSGQSVNSVTTTAPIYSY